MTKKLVLLFSVVLFIGSLFFFAYPEKKEEQPAETLTAGALAGQVKEASRLYKRLAKTLEADQVKLCFEGEELACDREQMIFYLPVLAVLYIWAMAPGNKIHGGGFAVLLILTAAGAASELWLNPWFLHFASGF